MNAVLSDTLFYYEDWLRCRESRFEEGQTGRPAQPQLSLYMTNHSDHYVRIPYINLMIAHWDELHETVALMIGKGARRLWHEPITHSPLPFKDYFSSMASVYPGQTLTLGLPRGLFDLYAYMPADTGRFWLRVRYLNGVTSDSIPYIWTGWTYSDTLYFTVSKREQDRAN
jgi:hypothetical protein